MVGPSEGRGRSIEPSGTPISRSERLARFEATRFDLVVVGGGITGAAVAEEAAARGVSVALIERDDYATGASGHTSKLLHGGLRYLAQGKFGLVREALRERSRLLSELDPAWVHPFPFLLPLRGSTWSRLRNRFGTWLYERLAAGRRLGPRTILGPAEVLDLVPALDPHGLRGGILYWEAIVDDVALTMYRIESAARAGALVANHMEAIGAEPEPGGGFRIRARDTLSDRVTSIRSRWIVDATGAWMGRIPLLSQNAPRLMPSKGIHLVFRREKLSVGVAVVLPGPDDRPTFVLPVGSLLVVGTTDTAYRGDPGDAYGESSDVAYLFRTLRTGFPAISFHLSDVVDVYAGVRPLLAATAPTTSELSREDVEAYDPSGAIAVAGGKLTTHRAMAARALKLLPLPTPFAPSTVRPATPGAVPALPVGPIPLSSATELMARLVRDPRQEDWEELRRRVVQAVGFEQAESLEDLIDRRLHALNRREAGFEAVVAAAAGFMAELRGGSVVDRDAIVQSYRKRREREYAGLETAADV
jgi:glycerol-3-phosphate dehydrogenase